MNDIFQQFMVFVRRFPVVMVSLAIFLLLSVANYFLWQRQLGLAAQHDEVRRNGEAMLSALSGFPRVTAQLDAVQKALKVIDQNLVVEGDLAENLGYFFQMGTRSQVRLSQLNQLSSQPQADGSPYKSVPFSLRAAGTYPQIISFLRELEKGPRLLRIRTYSFSRSDPKSNILAMDLTVEMLARP